MTGARCTRDTRHAAHGTRHTARGTRHEARGARRNLHAGEVERLEVHRESVLDVRPEVTEKLRRHGQRVSPVTGRWLVTGRRSLIAGQWSVKCPWSRAACAGSPWGVRAESCGAVGCWCW